MEVAAAWPSAQTPHLPACRGDEFSVATFPGNFLGLLTLGLGTAKGPEVEAKGRVCYDPSSFNFSQNHCRLVTV